MKRLARTTQFLVLTLLPQPALHAQSVVTLEVEVQGTAYGFDTYDWTKLARSTQVTTPPPPPANFFGYVNISDVLRVNGRPARGTAVIQGWYVRMSPTPAPGVAIADTARNNFGILHIELQDADGRDVGTISLQGFFGGPPPPGAPPQLFSTFAVVGGTGAFFGARGQVAHSAVVPIAGGRAPASVTEDPSLRRSFGDQMRIVYTIQLIPNATPQIEGVYHSNFNPVTSDNPARPGETLIVKARGLGPLTGLSFGDVAPELAREVASPVEAIFGGSRADVTAKVGWPGTADTFRVDVRIPEGVSGEMNIQLVSAWIPSVPVRVPVR